jgi:KDO2-lipid IV(A) lauroyltransferase
LPEPFCVALARLAAVAYRIARPDRFEVVVENLLPVHDGDRVAATRAAKANFGNFARKLVDLWRHESGVPLGDRAQVGEGWEHFLAATRTGRGVLLVTPHLGNWEFGAPLLARRGVELLVLTAPEPGDGFTELRAEARRRQGIETLVVGEDPFAFVEVVRRLQDGGVVALLVDRPAAGRAVEVEFFGRPCLASIAAAELARATGCIVLPVFVVAEGRDHIAHTLPPIEHDRRELGDRASRIRLTGRILRAFEPAVRRFSAQWFHFVPVWPAAAPRMPEKEERT